MVSRSAREQILPLGKGLADPHPHLDGRDTLAGSKLIGRGWLHRCKKIRLSLDWANPFERESEWTDGW